MSIEFILYGVLKTLFLKQLEEFCGVLNGAQNMLAKHLSFIKETRDAKKVTKETSLKVI